MLSNFCRLKMMNQLGSPKNFKTDQARLFKANQADTPSSKQAIKLKNTKKTNIGTYLENNEFMHGKRVKHQLKHPQSTKNMNRKVNFFKDNLNYSKVERKSGVSDGKHSNNYYSFNPLGGGTAYNVYNTPSSKNGLLQGTSSKSKKNQLRSNHKKKSKNIESSKYGIALMIGLSSKFE